MAALEKLEGAEIGGKPRPRVLGVNTTEGDRAAIQAVAAHAVFVSFFGEVRLAEFDVVVVRQRPTNANRGSQSIAWHDEGLDTVLPADSPVPFAILLCGEVRKGLSLILEEVGPTEHQPTAATGELEGNRFLVPGVPGSRWNEGEVAAVAGSVCTEFVLPKLDPALERLVKEDLVPKCVSRGLKPHNPVLRTSGSAQLQAFLATADGEVIAGRYAPDVDRETWVLPAADVSLGPWLILATRYWRAVRPERFRELSTFDYDPRWLTDEERSIHEAREQLQSERSTTLADLDRREKELEAQLAEASSAADVGARTLLTGEGATLVTAVQAALERLGFIVEEMDASREGAGHDLLEDLRVTDPEVPEWVALVEVRSYKGGAQLRDLMRLTRFEKRYIAETGSVPDRVWYVVNQFRDRDPSSADRVPVLPSHPAEVEEFGAGGGLVLDTSELFDIAEHTEADDMRAVRSTLRDAIKRLT